MHESHAAIWKAIPISMQSADRVPRRHVWILTGCRRICRKQPHASAAFGNLPTTPEMPQHSAFGIRHSAFSLKLET
jgi:hypothetical protein